MTRQTGALWDDELDSLHWSEVETWQGAQVESFVAGLAKRSSFYAEKLEASGTAVSTIRALELLPFTTKADLRLAQEKPVKGEPFGSIQGVPTSEIIQTVSSSGTSGRPVHYALTAHDHATWNDGIANMFFTAGIRPTDVIAHLTRLPMVGGGLPYADALRNLGATLVWAGGLSTERTLETIKSLQATALTATVSFEVYLAEHCREVTGYEPSALGLQKLIGGGEPGMGQPEIRSQISNAWGITHLREAMGLSDVMAGMWAECDHGNGMHFCAQRHVVIELIDPDSGNQIPWTEGATGEVVYTTFGREATPVLRFRSGDIVVVTDIGCTCTRTAPKISCVGRTDDMLIYKAMNVFPSAIRDVILNEHSDRLSPHMRIWKERIDQVRFDHPIPIEVEGQEDIETDDTNVISRQIEASVRERLGVRVDVVFVATGTIPRTDYKTALVQVRSTENDETTS